MAVATLSDLVETAGTAGSLPRARASRWLRRFKVGFALVSLLAVILLALGAAVGRYHAVPIGKVGAGVHVPHNGLAILVPTSPLSLRDGDVVMARTPHTTTDMLYKLTVVDSWTHEIYATDPRGRLIKLQTSGPVGRLSRAIPFMGTPFRLLDGELQGILLLVCALLVGIRIGSRRRYYTRMAELQRISLGLESTRPRRPRRPGFLNASWTTRLVAAVLAMVGMFGLTASANFSGTASGSVSQDAINAGHVTFTLPSVGSTYRLQTGVTYMAPGDLIERPIDLQMNSSNSSGILASNGVQLTMSTTTDTAGATAGDYLDDNTTNSLRLWILGCNGSSTPGWTETPSGSTYSYSCGGGGTLQDILGTYHANNASLPVANTCSYTGASSVNAAESVQNLASVNTTAGNHNYWVVFMCLPTANPDGYQDASITLRFWFTAVQRGAIPK
jgi:hypothetical protein